VRRPVLERYRLRCETEPAAAALGHRGKGWNSGEDSLMMRGAAALGFSSSYQPGLVLTHHVDPRRFALASLCRMMFSDGRSHAILARLGARKSEDPRAGSARRRLQRLQSELRKSVPYFVCRSMYRLGFLWESALLRWHAGRAEPRQAGARKAES
jgi:hypothetical protein